MNTINCTIIGSGPAGLTAAIYLARAGFKPLVISGNLEGGQLTTTTDVENYPGFIDGILGPDLILNMKKQAEKFGTTFSSGQVISISKIDDNFIINLGKESITSKSVIIATGASPRYLGIPGESELLGFGVSTCATCDGAFFREQIITVVGGGDSACEEALFLSKFGSSVNLIHRKDNFRASKIMADRVKDNPKINILWNTEVLEVVGDKSKGIEYLKIINNKDNQKSELKTDGLFIAIGHDPNSGFLKGLVDFDKAGYILNNANSTKTNVEGIFACGDVVDNKYRQAITAAGSGCMAALDAQHYLSS